jgi:hypothetical protein
MLGAVGAGAVLAAVLWWRPQPAPAPPVAAPRAVAEPARYDIAAAPAPRPTSGPAPAPRAVAMLRAALVARLPAALPRELLEPLAAGDVGAVAQRLAAGREPGGAAALAELWQLCHELDASRAEADAAAARSALGAAARGPAAGAALETLIAARRAAEQRLAAGCAAARFDPVAIDRQLQASARNGDAASLERLALAGSGDPGRLASAALLGAPRAQLRLGLDNLRDQPALARSWLEAAAKHDADAEAFLGACLLAGCGARPEPLAGRAALESAARRGAPFALGLLSSGAAADEVHHWLPAGAVVAPLPPPEPDALGLAPADRLAWAALAGRLADGGCFGFDLGLAAEALAARPALERSLSPADVAAGARAADELEAASGAAARHARGCE